MKSLPVEKYKRQALKPRRVQLEFDLQASWLTSSPILTYPGLTRFYFGWMLASNEGIGAVLSQNAEQGNVSSLLQQKLGWLLNLQKDSEGQFNRWIKDFRYDFEIQHRERDLSRKCRCHLSEDLMQKKAANSAPMPSSEWRDISVKDLTTTTTLDPVVFILRSRRRS
ncbi:hypothetical protein AVEN_54523-1 [Araneus ventricosus]|uniref:Uncharacterized protein n=1 Tax=Araneus ventricosus TaxID=182803 RepID=A0A4Y2EKS2_ARAVE|nr:hypothetical protein AVEN_54523-1 [Araneus ventricosus]